MSKINDGGPAFPIVEQDTTCSVSPGLSLRDYYAAKAMQGAFTSPIEASKEGQAYIAMHAYRMADAMIAARGTQ